MVVTAPWAAGQATKASGADLCYTCHQELKAKFNQADVHEPVRQGQCELCHSPHAARFPKLLRFKGASLCYACHADKKEAFTAKTAHGPVKQGECLKCHDPHASPKKGLLAKEASDLCGTCHEKVVKASRKVKHMPFETGDCLQCHQAHTSPERNLLVKPAVQLCQDCHQVTDPKIARVHQPFTIAKASCVSCHGPHGSDRKGMIKTVAHQPFVQGRCASCHQISASDPTTTFLKGAQLCYTCHANEARSFRKTLVHPPVASGQCTACHTPHASEVKGLLGQGERETCLWCHEKVEEKLARSKYSHPAKVEDGRCTICHTPHASDRAVLFPEDSLKVCGDCHKEHVSLSHPMGPGVIDPRTKRQVDCMSCHDPHGTQLATFLTFPKERELCIQCHRGSGEVLRTR
jgi:predicted CXXCH cytochrome family protein